MCELLYDGVELLSQARVHTDNTHTLSHSFTTVFAECTDQNLLNQHFSDFQNFSLNIRNKSCGQRSSHISSIKQLQAKMKRLQRLSHCSVPCLVFLTTLISNSLASDVFFEDTIEDGAYLRREHCLTKPYHGKNYL